MAESELFCFNTGGTKPSLRKLGGVHKPSSGASSKEPTVNSDSEDGSSSSHGGSGYSSDEDGTRRRK